MAKIEVRGGVGTGEPLELFIDGKIQKFVAEFQIVWSPKKLSPSLEVQRFKMDRQGRPVQEGPNLVKEIELYKIDSLSIEGLVCP